MLALDLDARARVVEDFARLGAAERLELAFEVLFDFALAGFDALDRVLAAFEVAAFAALARLAPLRLVAAFLGAALAAEERAADERPRLPVERDDALEEVEPPCLGCGMWISLRRTGFAGPTLQRGPPPW